MNLIEISKAPKDLCIKSFKENILNNFSLEYVSKLSSSGQLGLKYLRGMVWKILLGVLPPNDSLEKWKEKIIYLRKEYKIISDKIKKKQNYFEEKEKNNERYSNNSNNSLLIKSIYINPLREEKETKELINLDLKRTFQDLVLFHDERIINILSHILFVWSAENEQFGYQQGMNDILSIIFLALYPYYFENDLKEKNNIIIDNAEELYLFFNDEDELESDLYICFNNAMKKGINNFYEFEFISKEKQNEYIKKICLFNNEMENIIEMNEEINLPLYIRCFMIIHEKLKILDFELYSHLKKIGLNAEIIIHRWIKCIFIREFNYQDVLIIWDSIISSPEIKIGYDLAKIDIIALSMLLRIRNFLFLCDQSQSYMILLQYPKIENILELIIFSDKIKEAINELLSGKKSLFLENITNFSTNNDTNNNKDFFNNKNDMKNTDNIKSYEEGVKRLEDIFNKYHSLMEVNDEKEFINIMNFFKNYK